MQPASIIYKWGRSDTDVKAQIGKAGATYLQFKNSRQSTPNSEFSMQTLRQFHCTELRLEELLQSSSKKFIYL